MSSAAIYNQQSEHQGSLEDYEKQGIHFKNAYLKRFCKQIFWTQL